MSEQRKHVLHSSLEVCYFSLLTILNGTQLVIAIFTLDNNVVTSTTNTSCMSLDIHVC